MRSRAPHPAKRARSMRIKRAGTRTGNAMKKRREMSDQEIARARANAVRGTRRYQEKFGTTVLFLYRRLLSESKRRGISCSLSLEQYTAKRSGCRCFYCGMVPEPTAVALDRVDSTLGYTDENTLPCCHLCNVARGSLITVSEFSMIMNVRLSRGGDPWQGYREVVAAWPRAKITECSETTNQIELF